MQSKAFAKSQKVSPTYIFGSINFNTLSVSLKARFSVDVPFLHKAILFRDQYVVSMQMKA